MFEFHGWVSVRSDTYEIDAEPDDKLLAALKAQIATFEKVSGMVAVHLDTHLNGSLHSLTVAGLTNHRFEPAMDLFEWIAEHGPGSYGLLYVWDQEDGRADYAHGFRVWRLSRGRLKEVSDPFLSPCIPTVEDPHDPARG